MNDSPLNAALRSFEVVEANLIKLDKVLTKIEAIIPQGIAFGDDPEYANNCRAFTRLLESLPKIDNWKPDIVLMDLDEIAQNRFDAQEIGEIEVWASVERQINEPSKLLNEYRFRFNQKRRELIRDTIIGHISSIDGNIQNLAKVLQIESEFDESLKSIVENSIFEELKSNISQIEVLLGSSVPRPARWGDLHRHMRFGLLVDLRDIIEHDWPSIKPELYESLYDEKEPIPNEVDDLGTLVNNKPQGPIASKLLWERLSEEDFERVIYMLISAEHSYENPEWLTKTNAPDRGRDLSVYRIYQDPLGGITRQRVIIQCKHWLSKSVGPKEVATLREQMKLWEPPIVDLHVLATSGRFTSDAIAIIERQNQSDSALRIEMWPESHLEYLLASRPAIIAEFSLR